MALVSGQSAGEMQHELRALLGTVLDGELAPDEFLTRLETIHVRFFGDDFYSAEHAGARFKALAAYEQLSGGIERHHQIELLSQALGITS